MEDNKAGTNENDNIEIKIILGAKRTRVIAYDGLEIQPPFKNKGTTSLNSAKRNGPSPFAELNYARRLKERKENFYAIVYNNFQSSHSVMITLTFSPQNLVYCDLGRAHVEFVKFIKRLNWHYKGFKYIASFSRQKNGNWHYHMICNITDMDQKQWMKVWKLGLVWVSYIPDDGVLRKKAIYCVKNMLESASDDLHAEKGYLCSHDLNRNLVFRSWNPKEAEECWKLFDQIKEKPKKELYTTTFSYDTEEEWTYHYIRSTKIFSDRFSLLESAVRKQSKGK